MHVADRLSRYNYTGFFESMQCSQDMQPLFGSTSACLEQLYFSQRRSSRQRAMQLQSVSKCYCLPTMTSYTCHGLIPLTTFVKGVTQWPRRSVEQHARCHRHTMNAERHPMIYVHFRVKAWVLEIICVQWYTRKGSKVGWMVVLPLYIFVSNVASRH